LPVVFFIQEKQRWSVKCITSALFYGVLPNAKSAPQ
jgi:hypothetical protein